MTAGLPGAGIGGVFYLGSALFMPVRQLYSTLAGRRHGGSGWRVALGQAGMALAILGAMWGTGWLLALGVRGAARAHLLVGRAPTVAHHNLFAVAALLLSFGSLALVLLVVQLLRLVAVRPGSAAGARVEPRPGRRTRSAAAAMLAAVLTLTPATLRAQTVVFAGAGAGRSPGGDSTDVTRARALARNGRTDGAISAYDAWLAAHPGDGAGWRELGRQLQRAGRLREAEAALVHALAIEPDAATRSRLAAVRVALRPAVQPLVGGSLDSDQEQRVSAGASLDAAVARGRLGLVATRARVSDGGLTPTATSDALQATLRVRPLATLALDASAGIGHTVGIVPDSIALAIGMGGMHGRGSGVSPGGVPVVGTTATEFRVFPTGRLRLRYRGPAGAPALEIRAFSIPVDASPALTAAGAVRDELGATLELPAGPLRLRGSGRLGDVRLGADRNGRVGYGAALAVPVSPAVQFSVQVNRLGYAHAIASGYFAPRAAETLEGGTFVETDLSDSFSFSADVGGGVARLQRFGESVGPWGPSLRLWSMAAWTVMPGRILQLEAEAYDTKAADAVKATAASAWRYASLSASLHIAL